MLWDDIIDQIAEDHTLAMSFSRHTYKWWSWSDIPKSGAEFNLRFHGLPGRNSPLALLYCMLVL